MLKANTFATFIAFFVPVFFVTNLFSVITAFGWGLVNYHSYLAIAGLFLYLILRPGLSTIVLVKEVSLISIFYCTFMFVCLSSLLFISNEPSSIQEFMGYAWMCIFCLGFVFAFKHEGMLKATSYGSLVAVLLMSFINIYEFVDSDFRVYANAVNDMEDVIVGRASRILGLHPDQNTSSYAIVFSVYVISYYLNKKLAILIAILSFFPVVATFSRSGIVLWALVLLLIAITTDGGKLSIRGALAGTFTLALITYMVLSGQLIELLINAGFENSLNQDMRDRLSGNIFNQTDASSGERKDLVSRSVEAFTSNPIGGIGLGIFGSDDIFYENSAHNMFLQLGAELGLMGLASYVFLMAIPLFLKSWFAAKFSILAIFVSLFTHTALWEPWFLYCTAMALVFIPRDARLKNDGNRRRNKSKKRKRRKKVKKSSHHSTLQHKSNTVSATVSLKQPQSSTDH